MLAFQLTMPQNNSANGKWTGDQRLYYRTRSVASHKESELAGQRFTHDFGDGWVAMVSVEKVSVKKAQQLERKSAGFAGYDWMISDILTHGRILSEKDRAALKD